MNRIYKLGLVLLILVVLTGCDQATKSIARTSLASAPPISLLHDSVRFEYTENPGAILGLGADLPAAVRLWGFAGIVSIILVLTFIFALKRNTINLPQLVGLSFVAAGGLGNLLDRLYNNGAVVDFANLGIGPLRTGIFNLADVAIVAGVCIILLFSMQDKPKPTPPESA